MSGEEKKRIPKTTVYRLSVYYRALSNLEEEGVDSISSADLSEIAGFSAAQIRKDLTYYGQFGRPGRGYVVSHLKSQLRTILGID
ncbi:MAG TPA: redox-sensing transcriptional repressor Rex, partial [Firmicutes bacterium]|nr:redox-sensing transcriptional repressor Rex [Bacillota bacterium]